MHYRILIGAVGVALLTSGCMAPRGGTAAEKRLFVDRMARETLDSVYEKHPAAQQKVENAEGYGVFSDFGYALVFGGSAHGYGIVVDNKTGSKTYMRMIEGSEGIGIGAKEYRSVFVFHDRETLDRFVTKGLEFGVEGTAAVAAGEDTDGAGAVGSLNEGMEVHHITKKGFFVRAAAHAALYLPDKKLNAK